MPTLQEFAQAEGLAVGGSVCGVCRMHDPILIAIVDENERLAKSDPRRVSRKVVSAYLNQVAKQDVSVGAIEGHAKRHVK